ncbi:MAG: cytochrome c biogenesis CcdA family protein [Halobacteriota archaeon]|nr:cytochrome c biogenesis CcdA family protein [Halobacteriota archaeon]
MINPLVAFLFGMLSFINPCVLPVVPAVVAYSTESGRSRPIAIAIGLSISFTIMGVIANFFGSALRGYLSIFRVAAGFIVIFFGLYMIFGMIGEVLGRLRPDFTRMNLGGRLTSLNSEGAFGGLLLGISLGIVWTPCIGPILGSILAMVALEGDMISGVLLLMVYSIGFVIPLLILAYASNTTVSRLSSLSKHGEVVKKISGVVLLLAGVYMVYRPLLTLLY